MRESDSCLFRPASRAIVERPEEPGEVRIIWDPQELGPAVRTHGRQYQILGHRGMPYVEEARCRPRGRWEAGGAVQPQTGEGKLRSLPLPDCTFDGEKLLPEYRKPFCWLVSLAEGSVCNVWRGIRDDFMNYLRSEECLEMARSVA